MDLAVKELRKAARDEESQTIGLEDDIVMKNPLIKHWKSCSRPQIS